MSVLGLRVCAVGVLATSGMLCAQNRGFDPGPRMGPNPVTSPAGINAIGGDIGPYLDSTLAKFDYVHSLSEEGRKLDNAEEAERRKYLLDSGSVSALDFEAPPRAVREFNTATKLLQEQNSPEAILHLKKAIKQYGNFVSAHNNLGLAYQDQGDVANARAEFELAAAQDAKFPGSFINLGRLELSQENIDAARKNLENAATLLPRDAGVLMMLTYADYRTQEFRRALETAVRVHGLDHKGMGHVHYIAAAAAAAMGDLPTVKHELAIFVEEDPTNPLAPVARRNLEALTRIADGSITAAQPAGAGPAHTFPNSDRLKNELVSLENPDPGDTCSDCTIPGGNTSISASENVAASAYSNDFTLRKWVDEVAIFFAVSSHGRSITDLKVDQVKILDANKPPERLLQFTPQSKLPMRLGLLIDTSGSVRRRFSFEKESAIKFVQQMLSNDSDLAFVAGFADATNVTQDFTRNLDDLAAGINQLKNDGGTALFDAVSFACWKLAAYPGRDHVANVLVVLTDGEDNYSKTRLKQALRDAETTGVTIYAISTSEHGAPTTAADRVLVEIAERTGGEAFFPSELIMLGHSLNKLKEIIRSRYLVAYRPADFTPNGSYRTVEIVAEQNGHRFQVHTRKGYFARTAARPEPSRPQ
jgi:VWFA-related protein